MSAWLGRGVVCADARIVVSSVSFVLGGEFEVGNSASLSWKLLMKISVIGFVRVPSVPQPNVGHKMAYGIVPSRGFPRAK